jgi:thiamine transporter ThiT
MFSGKGRFFLHVFFGCVLVSSYASYNMGGLVSDPFLFYVISVVLSIVSCCLFLLIVLKKIHSGQSE